MPAIITICGLVFIVGLFFYLRSLYNTRQHRKEMLAFIDEIDSKLTRLEQQDQLGERYLRIRERLQRYKSKT